MSYRDLDGYEYKDDFSSATLDVTSVQLSALGKMPVGDDFYLFGRLGFAQLEREFSYWGEFFSEDGGDSSAYSTSESKTSTKALFGLGMGYSVINNVDLRAEYLQHAKWDGATVSSLSLGVTYSF